MFDIVQRQLFDLVVLKIKYRTFEYSRESTWNLVNMDDKEQADRMAAAEAMSSLSSMILIRENPATEKVEKSKPGTKNRDDKSKSKRKDLGHEKDVGTTNGNERTSNSKNNFNDNVNVNCSVPKIIETQIDLTPPRSSPPKSVPTLNVKDTVPVNLISALSNAFPPGVTSNQVISFVQQTNQWVSRPQSQAGVKPHIPVVPVPTGPTTGSHSNTFDISKLKERLLASGAHRANSTSNNEPVSKIRPVPVSLVINQSLIKNNGNNTNRQLETQSGVRSQKGNRAVRKPTTNNNLKSSTGKPLLLPVHENKTSPVSSLLPSDSLIETVSTSSPASNGAEESEKTNLVKAQTSGQSSADKKKSDMKLPLKKRRVNYENDDTNSRSLLSNMSRLNVAKHSTDSTIGHSTNVNMSETPKDIDRNNVPSHMQTDLHSECNTASPGPSVSNASSTNSNILAQVVAFAAGVGTPTIKVDPQTSLKFLSEIHAALTPDEDGDLPLHIAVVQEHLPLVNKFVQLMSISKKSVDRYNKDQQTPLHLAVKLNFVAGVRVLLAANANVNLVDRSGSSSIHIAVKENLMECLSVLIRESKHPVELNNKDFEGMAPLHTAVINNNIGIASLLLLRNIDVDNMDGKSGRTPIYHAAEKKLCEMVYLLIKKGANPDIANYSGVTAIAAAQSRNLSEIAAVMSRGLSDIINRNAVNDGRDTKELLSNYLAEKAEKSPPDEETKSNDSVMITDNVSDPESPMEPMDLSSSSTENLIPKPAISPIVSEDYTNR